MEFLKFTLLVLLIALISACSFRNGNHQHKTENDSGVMHEVAFMQSGQSEDTLNTYEVQKSPEEWSQQLTAEQCYILRENGTETPFNNAYWNNKEEGYYYCGGCGQKLYSSATKYESGSGWPSFWIPVEASAVQEKEDRSFGVIRTEIVCSRCGSHLGHVFKDGPKPTGLRYCMNSAAMNFVKEDVNDDGKIE